MSSSLRTAGGAVGRDGIPASDREHLVRVDVADHRRHAGVVLFARHPLGAVAQIDLGHRHDRVSHQRLEPVVGGVVQQVGSHLKDLGPLTLARKPPDQLAAQGHHEVHVFGVGRVGCQTGDRLHVESGLAQDLEGSGVDHVRRQVALWAVVAFDDQAGVPAVADQAGRGQPDRPSDYEVRRFNGEHRLSLRRAGTRRPPATRSRAGTRACPRACRKFRL